MENLKEIEKRIAALQQEVGSSSEDEHDSVSSSSSDSSYDNDEEEKSSQAEEDELAPIPSLPPDLVPPPGLFLSAAKQPVKIKKDGEEKPSTTVKTGSTAKRVECSACCEFFPDDESYKKHSRSLKHRQNVVLRAGAAYEPANHEPNYCRACEMKFETVELLLVHRKTEAHKEAADKLARASYCALCKKQFTSPIQLRGHIIGKAHNDLVEKKTGVRPIPLSKPVEETKEDAKHIPTVKSYRGQEDQRTKRWKQT